MAIPPIHLADMMNPTVAAYEPVCGASDYIVTDLDVSNVTCRLCLEHMIFQAYRRLFVLSRGGQSRVIPLNEEDMT